MKHLLDRPHYEASGDVSLMRFVPWVLFLAVPLALAVGYLLCGVFRLGWYLIGVAPLAAGALTGGAVALAVWLGHCRNRWVGGGLGLVLGLVTYLGYYHFDMLHQFGFQHAGRVDNLPRYVYWRVLTDVQQEVGKANAVPVNRDGVVDQIFKWVFFGLDLMMAVLAPIGIGWSVASRPYSDRHRRWMTTASKRVTVESGENILTALTNGLTDRLGEAVELAPMNAPFVTTELRFDYLPHAADGPVYLSLSRVMSQGGNQPPRVELLVDRVLLKPEEVAELAQAVRLTGTGMTTAPAVPAGDLADTVSARVTRLPDGEAGTINTRGHIATGVFIHFSPLLLALAVIGVMITLVVVYRNEVGKLGMAGTLVGAMGVLVGSVWYMMRYEHFLPAVYQYRCVQRVFRRRAEPFVDPDDGEARFVEVIPRANWGRAMAQNATDLGLVKVDKGRRAVLFEGDSERWVIPAESIVRCEIEEFTELNTEPNAYNVHPIVVVTANVDGVPWEAPLSVRSTTFLPVNTHRRRVLAEELLARIAALRAEG